MNCILALGLIASVINVAVPVETVVSREDIQSSDLGVSVRTENGLPGCIPGEPDLPAVPVTFAIPSGETAVSVEIVAAGWETVPGLYNVRALQPPTPLVEEAREAVPPDPAIYETAAFWPDHPAILAGTSFRGGTPTAEILVFPYRWNPSTGELQRLSGLELSIRTETAGRLPVPEADQESARMLIVTVPSFEGVFSQLAQRRHSEGILTEVVTMDEVLSAAGGRDDAEALRNYIKWYRQEYGLDYVLLGGDTEHVPMRYAFAMECQAGIHPREDSLPCDLYFSDLDGDWDANANGVFGEVEDDVDLYPDVWVGRVTVNDAFEATAWYNKLTAYEDCINDGHLQDVLFMAQVLWTNPFTDGGVSKNEIQSACLPGFMNVTKLYQTLGNLSAATVLAAMSEGTNLLNHNGHAWYNGMSIGGSESISGAFLDGVDSNGRYSAFFYSIGCWSAAFDFDAVAEHFLTSAEGCGVCFIGNSSYGWGSPGNPAYGYSDILDRYFFLRLYQDRNTRMGQILAEAKDFYIPYGRWENVYRWHLYQVNLLGDPSFRPYRKIPVTPELSFPEFVTANTTTFPVQVSGCMTEGLLLCVHDEGNNHLTAILDASGYRVFELGSPPVGAMTVTLTGSGVRRTSLNCPQGTGPGPVISGFLIDDTGDDGYLSPGDQAQISLSLTNQGTEPVTGVSLEAQLVSGPAQLIENSMTFPDLAPGASGTGSGPLSLSIDDDALNNESVSLMLTLSAQQGTWEIPVSMLVHAPGLYFATYSVDDGGDMVPEPGETFSLIMSIANTGLLDAPDASAVITSHPSWMSFASDTAFSPLVPAGSTAELLFECTLAPEAPSPSFPWLMMSLSTPSTGYERADSMRLTIGETGVMNDVEGGSEGWTHGGTGDLWRVTELDSHSPTHSWQCGNDQGYQNGMNCWLLSPSMHLAPNSSLSFWTTFDVAMYGSDGLYPILHNMTVMSSDTLDFIGSGGALYGSGKGMGTGWVGFSYDLSSTDPEDLYQIEFRFQSDMDGSLGLGFFLDDILVSGGYQGNLGVSGPAPAVPVLGYPSPNPSASGFSLPINIVEPCVFTVGVYDLSGRLVRKMSGEGPFRGEFFIATEGLASGVYMLALSGPAELTRRVVVLR